MGWIRLNHTVDGNPNHQLMVYINPTMNICFQPSLKLVFFLGEIAGPSHMAHPQVLGAHPQVLQKKHGQHVKTAWWFGTFGFFSIFVPFSWECHDPNWLIFFRKGSWLKVAQPPTSSPCVSWAYSRVYQVVAKGCCVPIQCFYGSRTPIYPCYINGYTRGTRPCTVYHNIRKKVQGGAPYLAKLVPVTPISLWFMVDISIMLDAD